MSDLTRQLSEGRSLVLSALLVCGIVADQWADQWVSDHNNFRAKYGVGPVSWDPQAANLAQAWADRCQFQHGGADGYGQNIWMSSGGGGCNLDDVRGSSSSWASEEKDWDCTRDMWGDGCNGGWSNCGHVTQMVWEHTTRIGCACGRNCKLIVCNYNPPGNFMGQQPVTSSECSKGRNGGGGNGGNSDPCHDMFQSSQCRTYTEDPNQIDGAAVGNAFDWICSNYPSYCNDIQPGARYGGCNSAQRLSYIMNIYYQKVKGDQGNSGCDFGGLGRVN
ncbi:hypothetical protein PROFUN_07431 [Planoprotostelium fungivorum]|uniref:SCP domain-containing protein n=1 Tax=Planoprotostelium fungivorum TaxID=1890364 RepID=A0A2P6NLF0_9EUKA|nr:hypothetical protein PROFUN_07431 [Planoprotostelium fungivorum]